MSLKKDTIYNILGNGIPLLAAAITIPFLLKELGDENFGVLTLLWALVGYFGLFDFGIGRALTYQVSLSLSNGNKHKVRDVIKAGLALTLITGFFGASLVYFLLSQYALNWFNLSPEKNSIVKNVFEIIAYAIIPTTLTSGLRGALEGHQRFLESNINRIFLGVLMFIAPAMVVMIKGTNLEMVAWSLVLVRIIICFMALYQLKESLYGKIELKIEDFRLLMNFGVWVTISGLISPLMVYGDRFFVAANVGAESLPLYAIPQEGLQRLLIIPTALTVALLPRMIQIKDNNKLKEVYNKNLLRIAIVMFIALLIVSYLAPRIISIWISEEFSSQSALIVIVLCIGLWFNSLAQMSLTLIHSIGKPKLAAITHMIELPIYIVAIILLASKFGILGAAIAWSLRVFLDFIIFEFFVRKSMK
jgi:O-antigen/teichoic acid export membrane protein